MKKLIITITLFSFYGSYAQKTKSYDEQITQIYANVDKTKLKTGLFFEMGFPFQKLKIFNDKGTDILNSKIVTKNHVEIGLSVKV